MGSKGSHASITRAAKRVGGVDPRALDLTPRERMILSQVDGRMNALDFADAYGIPAADVAEAFDALAAVGAVELVDAGRWVGAGSVAGMRAAAPADEDADDALDIDDDARREIQDAFDRLHDRTFYELLDLPETAERAAVGRAYTQAAARFHPDRHFRKRLGGYLAKLETVFVHLGLARDVLSSPARRDEYDRHLARLRHAARGRER